MTSSIEHLTAALAGRYRIDREVGAGGMAIVYLAEEVKHRRRVAIKVLRDELVSSVGAERFLREIEIAAQLQHPNVLSLLDSGSADGLLYYVMPFVDGPSLRERLNREGRLAVGESLRIVSELADALAYAHERGVVHRDIKPDNVLLSGRHALIADFGVARAVSAATGEHYKTSVGIALGTPAYMSPEQVVADPNVDHRADLYSLGVLAYELLAGAPPFADRSPQQVLAAHVNTPPPALRERRDGIPVAFEQAIMKCLEKRAEDRWQSASALLTHLESIATPSDETTPNALASRREARNRRGWRIGGGIAALVLAAIVVWRVQAMRRGAPAVLVVGNASQFTTESGVSIEPDFSPDGRLVAYSGGNPVRRRIYVRPIGGGRSIALSNDSMWAEAQPRWSPDGNSLLYLSRGGVRIAPSLGGESRAINTAAVRDTIFAAAWSPDGKSIAYATHDSLFIVPIDSGVRRLVGASPELHSCSWSKVRDLIACVSGNNLSVLSGTNFGNLAPTGIVVFRASGGAPQRLAGPLKAHESPVWSPDGGTLYFVSDRQGHRDVYAVAIGDDGAARAEPTRITDGLGAHSIALSANGKQLAYSAYAARANLWSMTIPAEPTMQPSIAPLTSGNQVIESVRLSRDGTWLVYDSNIQGHAEIYRMRLPSGQPERLTNGADENFRGDLSPDGKEIAFHSFRSGSRDIYVQSIDGGPPVAVTNSPAQEAGPIWSPDGRSLAFVDLAAPQGVFVVHRAASGVWGQPVRRMPGGPGSPDWSPDGRLIVCAGGGVIYVAPVDSGPSRAIYTPVPGSDDPVAEQVVWGKDATILYFKSHDALDRASFWSIPVTGGRPKLLARLDDVSRPSNRPDFAIDGHRIFFAIQDRSSDIWIADVARR